MRRVFILTLTMVCALTAGAQGPNGSGAYYKAADNLTGEALKTALFNIISTGAVNIGYSGLIEAYKKTDMRADGCVRDWYSSATDYTWDDRTGQTPEGAGWNREHSVPQSWFGEANPMKADIVHVFPTDAYVNNKRGNLPFGEVGHPTYESAGGYSKVGPSRTSGYQGTVFEPNDEIKGDIARIYFYMATRYQDRCASWGHDVFTTANYGLATWTLNMMLRWSKQDPVDARETARNNAVYELQKNRNPYVDYPGLEDYIWGDKRGVAFSYGGEDGDSQPGDGDEPGQNPGGQTVDGLEILLCNTTFGCTDEGAITQPGQRDLTATQHGITVVYSPGEGTYQYCNSSQIRLYPGNTLTLTALGGRLTHVEVTFAANSPGTELTANGVPMTGGRWTGDAQTLTIRFAGSSKHARLAAVRCSTTAASSIRRPATAVSQPRRTTSYTVGGRRATTGSHRGLHIVNGKKRLTRL